MMLAMRVLDALARHRQDEARVRRFVSGAALAQQMKVSRSAIWKAVSELRELGTDIEAVPRQGYRLTLPGSTLVASDVRALLHPKTLQHLRLGECAGKITSTNAVLLERGAPPPGKFDFLTAEYQTAGRGRRGRSWIAPPGGAICLSWSWCFDALPTQMGALSLAVGVAMLRALKQHRIGGVLLKWPNDLVTTEGKLGGILIEMRSESAGPVQVVVGLGLNVTLGKAVRKRIDTLGSRATDLSAFTAPPTRSRLVAALLDSGVAALQEFAKHGLEPFLAEYRAADALAGKPVTLHEHAAITGGIALGLDEDGALRVEHSGKIHRIIAGEVSVRARSS
jgi:BirA family transcriptional regulator, biotin operon repressor / biotin---[acetyl-CoA-carboxylase] ligase